jgi:hypothetical protein
MHAGNQAVPLVLKRPYENAKVVRCFLKLVAHGELAVDDDASSLQVISVVRPTDWEDLAMFLDTWSCDSTLKVMLCLLKDAVWRSNIDPLKAFIIASLVRNRETCTLVLERMADWVWPVDPSGPSMLEGTGHECVWNPGHWPLTFWRSPIPDTYLFALARAYGDKEDTDLATEFERYLDAATAKS